MLGKHLCLPEVLKEQVQFPGPASPGLSGLSVPLGTSPEEAATKSHCFLDALRKKSLFCDFGAENGLSLSLLTDAIPEIFNGNVHPHISLQGLAVS